MKIVCDCGNQAEITQSESDKITAAPLFMGWNYLQSVL